MASDDRSGTPAPLLRDVGPDAIEQQLTQLRGEHATTVAVVAILTERLLDATGGQMITITDEALHRAPDLNASRNDARKAVLLRVSR